MDDLTGYQSKETAWRYEVYRGNLIREMQSLGKEYAFAQRRLSDLQRRLSDLEDNPPMHHLFNWSA